MGVCGCAPWPSPAGVPAEHRHAHDSAAFGDQDRPFQVGIRTITVSPLVRNRRGHHHRGRTWDGRFHGCRAPRPQASQATYGADELRDDPARTKPDAADLGVLIPSTLFDFHGKPSGAEQSKAMPVVDGDRPSRADRSASLEQLDVGVDDALASFSSRSGSSRHAAMCPRGRCRPCAASCE